MQKHWRKSSLICHFIYHFICVIHSFCTAEYDVTRCDDFSLCIQLWLQSCIASVACLRKFKTLFSLCFWSLTSASGLWQVVQCWGLIVQACSRTEPCYDNLYCSLISSQGFPPASSPPILFTVQPSIILPLSEGTAKLSGT